MSIDLGSAEARIGLDYAQLATGIAVSKTLLGGLGTSVLGVAGITASLGVIATKMAGDFQSGITTLVTGAGEFKSNMGVVSDGILKMAVDTGTSTKDLISGMFMVESAGFRGAQALNVMRVAAEGARVQNADLGTVAFALTGILHDYHLGAGDAAGAMDALIASVKSGKMHLQDLASSMGAVLPLASSLGVSFPQVAGAVAEMTNSNTTAQLAAQHLAFTLSALSAPSTKAQKAMKEVGLSAQEVKDTLAQQGLTGALTLIEDHVGSKFPAGSVASVEALKSLLGGTVGWKTALALSGQNMKDYESNVKNITDAMKSGKDGVQGWTMVQSDFNTKVDQAKATVEVLGIKIGTALLPVASKLFDTVTPMVTAFGNWIDKSGVLQQITGGLTGVLGQVSGFVQSLTGNISLLGGGFTTANQLFGDFQAVAQNIRDILPDVGAFLGSVGTSVSQNLLPPLESLIGNVGSAVANFTNWADTSGTAKSALETLSGIVSTTTQILGPLITAVSDTVGWLGGGGAGTNTLIFALSAVATAFLLLKVADTTAQFGQFFAKISDGNGIVANLADAMKGKLAKSFDDFLSNQAPNFKKSLDDMKQKSADTAVAEAEVGTAAETSAVEVSTSTKTMGEDYIQLSLWADEAGTSVGAIGTDAEAAAGEVAASSVEMDGSMAVVEGSSVAAGGAMAGIGAGALAAAAALGTMAAMAGGIAILAAQLYIVKAVVIDGAPSIENGPAHIVGYAGGKSFGSPTAQADWKAQTDAMKAQAANLADSVSGSVKLMDGSVVQSLNEMNVKSYTNVKAFTSDTMRMFAGMGAYGTQQMQSLDKNAIGYWNDIAAYITDHPINADVNTSVGSTYNKLSQGLQKNYYASGVINAPSGWAVVGENGPELMHMKGGEDIYPHGSSLPLGSGSSSSSGGGGGSQPTIHNHIYLDGQELSGIMTSYVASSIISQSRASGPVGRAM